MMKPIHVDEEASESLSKSIRIEASVWNDLVALAAEKKRTPNAYVALVLTKYVEDLRAQGAVPSAKAKKNPKSA